MGRQSDHQPLFFFFFFFFFIFLKQWGGRSSAALPSLSTLLLCDWNRLVFFLFFLDFMIQEKRYLCVQILTNVCLCCYCLLLLLWKGEQDSEFSINFYFLFILFLSCMVF